MRIDISEIADKVVMISKLRKAVTLLISVHLKTSTFKPATNYFTHYNYFQSVDPAFVNVY